MFENHHSRLVVHLMNFRPSISAYYLRNTVGMNNSHWISHRMGFRSLDHAWNLFFWLVLNRQSIATIRSHFGWIGAIRSCIGSRPPSLDMKQRNLNHPITYLERSPSSDRSNSFHLPVSHVMHREPFSWTAPSFLWTERSVHHAAKAIFNIFLWIFWLDFCFDFCLKNLEKICIKFFNNSSLF